MNEQVIQTTLNKEVLYLSDIMNHMDLTDNFRIFHPSTIYTFSVPRGAFFTADHIRRHKTTWMES